MRERIRNILLESFIFQNPIFRAVAIEYKGKVYEGEPWMIHQQVAERILQSNKRFRWGDIVMNGVDGFVTVDGEFVTRAQAKNMVNVEPESDRFRHMGIMATA